MLCINVDAMLTQRFVHAPTGNYKCVLKGEDYGVQRSYLVLALVEGIGW